MTTIDIRFKFEECELLSKIIDKKLISVEHDTFHFTNSSSQALYLNTEVGNLYLYNCAEPLDYYGDIEDIAVFELTKTKYKIIDIKNFITMPVNEKVKGIQLVQENQRLFKKGIQTYDVWLTRGIIFEFNDYQIAFEKDNWLSEEIFIYKGYNLIEKFAPIENFIDDDWGEEYIAECERQIIKINNDTTRI